MKKTFNSRVKTIKLMSSFGFFSLTAIDLNKKNTDPTSRVRMAIHLYQSAADKKWPEGVLLSPYASLYINV